VKKIWGYTIVTEDNEVRNFKTLLQNLKGALTGGWPENVRAYFDLAERFKPDVVVSDFESWSYLFAVNRGLPVVSVDNMQIINRCRHDPELLHGHEGDFQIAKAVVKAKVPGAFHYLVTTFFYPEIRKEGTSLHPPILRSEILEAKREKGEHLLVYQTYTTNSELPEILRSLGRECRIYGLRRGLSEPVREGNLVYLPFSEQGFVDDLRTAGAVVAGGGFTLMGEAVYLRKPMLSEPVGKQFEQLLNARYLEALGYGLCAEPITAERLHDFLDQLPRFEERLATYSQDGNRSLFEKLEETIAEAGH
jgi:uncharacterized protein (TIGR00661 family)